MKVAVLASVLVAAAAPGTAAPSGAASAPPAPSRVYLGVACHTAATACGRVGVAVWLPRAAAGVTARLLGSRVALGTTHSGSGRYGFRRYWTGFARFPARRVHPGRLITVRITVAQDGARRTSVRSYRLFPGWG
jgi:hypothetical protein